jgi:thioester reductase-like protein
VKGLLSLERNFKYINDILIDIPLLAKKPENSYLANRPKTILLTGSSGFIGGYILDAIVRNKNLYKVYCLIRDCSNTQEGLRKIKNNLMTYGICLLNEKVITPINYNLELPNLGLSASDLNKLQTEVTDIVHVAGWVHHVYDYLTLRDVNVKGTIELINICAAKQSKRFHYISALSAINDFESGYIQETWPMKEAPTLSGGYNQTKWSCEMLVKKLSISGYQTYLYRLPTIWGASDNAAFTWQKDHQALLIRGCLELGYVPQIESFLILAPVNKIASLISQNIFNNNAASNVLNMVLFKPYSWNSLYNLLAKKYNFNFKFISFADWQNKLINLDKANAMYALSSLYLSYKTYQFAIKINETSCANFTNTFGIMPQNLNEDYLTQNLEQFLP